MKRICDYFTQEFRLYFRRKGGSHERKLRSIKGKENNEYSKGYYTTNRSSKTKELWSP